MKNPLKLKQDGIKKGYLEKELARLERIKAPVQCELDQVNEKIKKIKKELKRYKNVEAIQPTFLF